MPRSLRIQTAGYLHHVVCRGNDQLVLFKSTEDSHKYIDLLESARKTYPLRIYNYCLIDSSIHLLLKPEEDGNLSKVMEEVSKGYAKYFNKKYNRTGHVFQGRFKSFLVQDDRYYFACSRYIDLNPVNAGVIDDPKKYAWSGYSALAGNSKPEVKLDRHPLYTQLGETDLERQIAYRTLVHNHQGDDLDLLNKRAGVLGDSAFKKKFKKIVAMIGILAASLFGAMAPQSAHAQGLTIPLGSTVDIADGTLNVPGDLTIEGTLRASSGTITLTGDWINSTGTFVSGTGTVDFTGTDQSILGSTNDFYNLRKVTGLATLTFEQGLEQFVEGTLTLQGTSIATMLTLNSSGGAQFDLNLKAGGSQSLQYLNVNNSDATGLDLTTTDSFGVGQGNDNLDPSPHWVFGQITITWEGDISSDWAVDGNWNVGIAPTAIDNALIPSAICGGCVMPVLTAPVAVDMVTIQSGASLTLDGNDLTVTDSAGAANSGTLDNDGTLILQGSETLTIDTVDQTAGTFRYIGTNTAATHTIVDFGGTDYYNLEIDDTNANLDTFLTSGALTAANTLTVSGGTMDISVNSNDLVVGGGLTVSGGILTATNGTIDANSSVTASSGTLTAPTSGAFTVAGDWTGGASFAANSGTVTFDTTTTSSITGDTTFWNLTSTTAGKTMAFADTSTQTVNNTLTLTGESANKITLDVSGGVGTWNIIVATAQNVDFLNVSNSEVLGVAGDDIFCEGCIGLAQGNDDTDVSPHWIFLSQISGVVFEAQENFTINEAEVTIFRGGTTTAAVPGIDLQASDTNPFTTTFDGAYNFRLKAGDFYVSINAAGHDYPSTQTTFPDGRVVITGSKGEVFTMPDTEDIAMDHPVDFNGQLLRIEKDANKAEAHIAEVVTYSLLIENIGTVSLSNVLLEDLIPPGFKYLDNRVTLDGVPIANPTGNRPLVFDIGDFALAAKKTLKYQLIIGSGVTLGEYENAARARYASGQYLSNRATETVKIILDPLFDLGTIMGKVFFDKNANGIQDAPKYSPMDREISLEEPVPNVRIVMEDGTVITTDQYGRFSVPGILPGRHLFRLDERTLPEDSFLTTDKVVIVDVTQGSSNKVNFGVNMDADKFIHADHDLFVQNVSITQDKSMPQPRLNVSLFGEEIAIYNDVFVENAEMRIFTNYAPFIEYWRVEIFDEDTNRIIKQFEGDSLKIHDPIFWNGKDGRGSYVPTDRNYAYRVYVLDKHGRFDETKSRPIEFKFIADEEALENYHQRWLTAASEEEEEDQGKSFVPDMTLFEDQAEKEEAEDKAKAEEEKLETKEKEYRKWIEAERIKSNFLIQTILVDGETVFIDRRSSQIQSVQIVSSGKLVTDVPIPEQDGLTARELLEGKPRAADEKMPVLDVILPKGNYEIMVQEGDVATGIADVDAGIAVDAGVTTEGKPTIQPSGEVHRYTKPLQIGEDFMFFVGLGDAKIGYGFVKGALEPIAHDDQFNGGYWSKGKAAYFLKGKVKGKYLITSSFDTDRNRKELFRSINKEEYYPVYGDSSTIDYTAADTQGNLYLLIEWNKSSVLWGNYSVGFNETEYANYERTLYGGKLDFESLSATPYGESRSKIIIFHARAQQKPAHNEFLATGGSLYFFKHKDVVEGSDIVKIEVRDKITGLVISERVMVEGADYEMDYKSGRMLFWRPVPMLVTSYSIISSELLDGNLVYVVTDYEYSLKDKFDESSVGARARQAVGDHVVVGGTYVKDNQETTDYQLIGTDVTVHLGKDATVVAEYAESDAEPQGTFVSTDGGITFTELATSDSGTGRAFGIKGNAKLFNRLGVSSFYKWVDNDFSTSATTAQQGKELIGFEAVYDFTEKSRIRVRHDIQTLIEDGNLQTQLQVGATRTATTLIQMVHEARKLRLTGEYRRQVVDERLDQFDSQTNKESDTLAFRADYQLHDKVALSLEHQATLTEEGEKDQQTTLGAVVQPTDKITIKAEKTIGEKGVATNMDVVIDVKKGVALTGGYSVGRDREGNITNDGTATASVGAEVDVTDKVTIKAGASVADVFEAEPKTTMTLGGTSQVTDAITLAGQFEVSDALGAQSSTKVTVGGTSQVTDATTLTSQLEVSDAFGTQKGTKVTLGGASQLTESIKLDSTVEIDKAAGTLAPTTSASVNLGGITKLSETTEVGGKVGLLASTGADMTSTVTLGGRSQLTEDTEVGGEFGVTGTAKDRVSTVRFGGKSKIDDTTQVEGSIGMTGSAADQTRTMTVGGKSQIDEKTQTETQIALTDSLTGGQTKSFTFGTKRRLTDDISVESKRIFGSTPDSQTTDQTYSLVREKNGRKLEGSLARRYSSDATAITRSNIFGLTGDINDRWAFTGSFERGDVQNLDGTKTERSALSVGIGYAKKDAETGESLTSSTKFEMRDDQGDVDRRQYLFYHTTDGKITQEVSVYTKLEYSRTDNLTADTVEAEHKEFIVGGAYRPLYHDRLNLLGRYTYLEEKSPEGQEDNADIEEEKTHVIAAEGIYDVTEKWQVAEKFVYRIAEEKVTGFDFNKTHTWLMIHRLNYKLAEDWSIGGEFRTLAQEEAKDVKRGFLFEASRNIGEYAQLGVGYNLTDFDDDITSLDYTAHGPFIRLTGKLYDQTPEEIERAKAKWIDAKVERWAWIMVQDELTNEKSPILDELNQYFLMAQKAYEEGEIEESRNFYKDIIVSGEMMFEEASAYIRGRIDREKGLKDMSKLADQYYKNGQYEKAKKILEKILEEVQRGVVE